MSSHSARQEQGQDLKPVPSEDRTWVVHSHAAHGPQDS